ncbi:hypothetical protein IWW38_003573, partial [Coemansia aciculifera]
MECPPLGESCSVSLEQVRAAFESGAATEVSSTLTPFLRAEWKSNGDRRVINEVAICIGRLVYRWFQSSEAMDAYERKELYSLLQPDGVVLETLLQYNTLNKQQQSQSADDGDGWLTIGADSLPVEWHGKPAVAMAYLKAHAPPSVLYAENLGAVELRVGALEYVLYHICRALVPLRGLRVPHGTLVARSVVYYLARELINFFLPVAVPKAASNSSDTELSSANRSPISQLRNRLHSTSARVDRRMGYINADTLDACSRAQATDLAQYFAFCAALVWLPTGADANLWMPS